MVVCWFQRSGKVSTPVSQEHALERLLLPLSGLASWLIVLAGGLSLLHVLGINVAPLLTVGGVSGIMVGLSAQSVMANMIAGINLVSKSSCRSMASCALPIRLAVLPRRLFTIFFEILLVPCTRLACISQEEPCLVLWRHQPSWTDSEISGLARLEHEPGYLICISSGMGVQTQTKRCVLPCSSCRGHLWWGTA